MTLPEVSQFTLSLGTLIGVIVSALVSLRNSRHIVDVKKEVAEVAVKTNGMSERLELAAKTVGLAQGHAQGVADQKRETQMLKPIK